MFEQAGADPEVVQFINVLHGKESSGGPIAAFAYALSGISVLAVFGLMSLAVIIAKLAALALMLTLFAVMTLALFTRDGLERVFRFCKTYIGLSFFVFASSLVMAILALITKICMSIGGTLLSSNELLATMWAGLSPLLGGDPGRHLQEGPDSVAVLAEGRARVGCGRPGVRVLQR